MTASNWNQLPAHQRTLIALCFALGVDFIWRGRSELLVSRAGVDLLLTELERLGERVLGLEGFNIDSEGLHPRLDLIYDADRAPSARHAREAVSEWPDDVWIELVLSGGS